MKRKALLVVVAVVPLLGVAVYFVCLSVLVDRGDSIAQRPENWAQPVARAGLENLHKVSDDLYRGEQPSEEGMAALKEMGIKTIVNLRSFHSDRAKIGKREIGYEHINMKAWNAEDEEIVRFLKIINDKEKLPVFVHCQHGADRTGTMCAIYRIAVQGWSKEDAIQEMQKGGFGYHGTWQNLLSYVRGLEIEEFRREAGLSE